MLELVFSALITIVPDYLYRRYKQGKRWGREITLFNVWYELRWGLTACAILAVTLITVIFYFHPSTRNVSAAFRTVTILSDRAGRVAEVYVANNDDVNAGEAIFRLDTTRQEAAAETAQRRIEEIEAALGLTATEVASATAQVEATEADLAQATSDLERRLELAERNNTVVSEQELERLQTAVSGAESQRASAIAALDGAKLRQTTLLPAQLETARAVLREAENEISKSTVFAEVDGTVTQFLLKPGDIVNPILRPAGILVPEVTGQGRFIAAFGQISASVLKPGMLVEITCASKPLTIVPMVVDDVQDAIAAGQFRPGDALLDQQDRARPGTVTAFLAPVFPQHLESIPPGSACVGVAYTSRAKEIDAGEITGLSAFIARIVDGMGIANAIVLRAQAILLPVKTLVFN
ncbi:MULTISPECIES: HlyD family secretion protein [unclassified Ruegeria]|uniref:HlyD family secretion protein n=1 Tax=unclassified Ruegeria TaxID=2625375 RepID=UPI001489BE34|nr:MULTISPECIES: HlyD family secretion protein [unclassified Ruegeria]NOD75663.1 biotin/lipoyl-binding protein [Ruegeria sp. HKCCD4332]NOD89026.1 biotin/lipoyl-binding protein [Ruegeria sp. HKCCD4318]NOE14388.1 biotin/lipoyl-binding protein [Ruegeria sp. HKCCD4318-2]NOG10091.1 HlyD family secretion protein [Ruegeria sp. HKCCD4315]